MEINDILSKLGLDFSNAEAKRGAMEAIDAILASRIDLSGLGGGGGGLGGMPKSIDVEVDPDLLQPSVKHNSPMSDDDVEIEDEEKLLDKVKHNKNEDPLESEEPADTGEDSEESGEDIEDPGEEDTDEPGEPGEPGDPGDKTGSKESEEPGEPGEQEEPGEPGEQEEPGEPSEPVEGGDSDDEFENQHGNSPEDGAENEPEEGESEEEYSEDDLIDDELKQATKDETAEKKAEARRRKRERTLRAAKATLEKAQAAKAPKELVTELENAIAELEALLEAAAKNLADLSDEEFNRMINRVFDAIDALNPGELTYSSEEERQAKAQEIKTDMSSTKTQAELSAEDAEAIRAEHQAVKAREAEVDKYRPKSRKSFQGFQAFMASLQRGIALQVSHTEERDDTWSAISRRNSGAGVLRQGQRINELPNKKIPIIDFYFDQSGSWDESDLEVGNQAVEALAQMEADGKIKVNIYYFSNHVFEKAQDARDEGGTAAWNDIVKNIVATGATNVVIMTDDDMENWWTPGDKPALKHTVSGFVWYLWRNGENAPRLPRDLQGRGGTLQYSC